MGMHYFTLILRDEEVMTEEISDRLFEAGIDGEDTLVVSHNRNVFVKFERKARSLGDAVKSAVEQVMAAGYDVACVEVEGVR